MFIMSDNAIMALASLLGIAFGTIAIVILHYYGVI